MVAGPVVLLQESAATVGPLTVQVGAPAGAREPVVPVMVAV